MSWQPYEVTAKTEEASVAGENVSAKVNHCESAQKEGGVLNIHCSVFCTS